MSYLIYGAEIATLLWFLAFLALSHRLRFESQDQPAAPRDPLGRQFILAARLGFALGLAVLAVATAAAL